jgi:hypothetical protein
MGQSMKVKRTVTQEDIDHLPTEIHRKVAKQLIIMGEWRYVTTSSYQRMSNKSGGD